MQRLTNKYGNGEDWVVEDCLDMVAGILGETANPTNVIGQLQPLLNIEEKLAKLEDIEEEYGIDLLLLFRIAKADKIYNKFSHEIQEWTNFKIDLKNKKVWYSFNPGLGYGASRELSGYGKTWALTREELENDH